MTRRDKLRRVVLVVATLVMAAMVLYPPWVRVARHLSSKIAPVSLPSHYAFLRKPPTFHTTVVVHDPSDPDTWGVRVTDPPLAGEQARWNIEAQVDVTRLLLQCVPVALFAGLGWVLLRD